MEKVTKTLVFLMMVFSAMATYFYDSYLNKAHLHQFSNDEIMFQPTEEQLSRARRLGLEDRFLATTKEVWTECVDQSMSAIECKFFIDDEILRFFTGPDRFIRTRIIGKRANYDDWYNAVVITMDDNDFALGRDSDGWIYYTFQWEGSGTEATTEQQAEIPPITASETSTGATQGSDVDTVYAPDAVAEHPSANPDVTTTPPPPPPGQGGGIHLDYSNPPIVVQPEPILVQGATTDGAIAGTDDNPLNGGVILDGSVASSGEGQGRLAWALNEPPEISAAGSRTIGPFDCRGMTGFDCCLLIKHKVRDADINGRAIQCHLDYEETTCKKKWWLETEESKKVLIYANHNEMVSEDPVISGSWPQCDEKWPDHKRDWSGEVRCGKDFGDSLCPEGQCCSAHGYCGIGGAWCDFGCQSQCWTTSDTGGLAIREQCGPDFGGKVCHGAFCCSASGQCGSGPDYCVPPACGSQCWSEDPAAAPPQIPQECKANINICIALDMSGSVCSPDFNNPTQCKNCPSACKSGGFGRDICCPNFNKIKEFSTAAINWINLLQFGINHRKVSIVTFATNARTKVGLGEAALTGLDTLDYSGGLTNHGDAIKECERTFDGAITDGSNDPTNIMLLVTDGVATTKTGDHNAAEGVAHGRNQARLAKEAGTNIETVFINPAQAQADTISYMNDLSSSGSHYDVSDFDNLDKMVNDIAYKIACSGDGAIIPVAAPVDQASVPSALQAVTYCGCSTCTESVMKSKAGKHTCRGRIDWLMKFPRGKSESEACATIYGEYPDVCKCSPTCDN